MLKILIAAALLITGAPACATQFLFYGCQDTTVAGKDTQGTCAQKIWTTATPGKVVASCMIGSGCDFGSGARWRLVENLDAAMVGRQCQADIQADVPRTDGSLCPAGQAMWATFDAPVRKGSVILNWQLPTQNTDGSALTDLAGFRILSFPKGSITMTTVTVADPRLTTFKVTGLSTAETCFTIKTYNAANVESTPANAVCAVPSVDPDNTVVLEVGPAPPSP